MDGVIFGGVTLSGITWTEGLGFATGAVNVWLIVRENPWNWPIGLANNFFYFIVFWESRLYADMGLQSVFFALGGPTSVTHNLAASSQPLLCRLT